MKRLLLITVLAAVAASCTPSGDADAPASTSTDRSTTTEYTGESFAGTVDATRAVARKWVKTLYTPDVTGDHQFVLDWDGDAMMRSSVKVHASGVPISVDTSNDRPKAFAVDLDAGVQYRIAVWAKHGSADFTLTAYPPPG